MSPVLGLSADFFALVSIFLRNLIVTWAGLVPALCLLIMVPRLYIALALVGVPSATPSAYPWTVLPVVAMTFLLLAMAGPLAFYSQFRHAAPAGAEAPPPSRLLRYVSYALILLALLGPLVLNRWKETGRVGFSALLAYGVVTFLAGAVLIARLRSSEFDEGGPARKFIAGWLAPAVIVAVAWSLLALRSGVTAPVVTSELALGVGVFASLVALLGTALAQGGWPLEANEDWPPRAHLRRVGMGAALGIGSALPAAVAGFVLTGRFSVEAHATVVVPTILCCIWLATAIPIALAKDWIKETEREWWARCGGWCLKVAVVWLAVFGFVIYAPVLLLEVPGLDVKAIASGGGVLGIVVSLVGYWSENGAKVTEKVVGVVARLRLRLLDVAAVTFIVALLLSLCFLVDRAYQRVAQAHEVFEIVGGRVVGLKNVERRFAVLDLAVRLAANEAKLIGENDEAWRRDQKPDPPAWGGRLHRLGSLRANVLVARNSVQDLGSLAWAIDADAVTLGRFSESLSAGAFRIAGLGVVVRAVDPETEASVAAIAERVNAATADFSKAAAQRAQISRTVYAERYSHRMSQAEIGPVAALALGFGALTLLILRFAGVNTFSLHSLYGNRLVRAYLGAARAARNPDSMTGFDDADNDSLWGVPTRPFHVVNATLNLARPDAGMLETQERKAASFTFTPLYSGSAAVGFEPTRTYGGRDGVSMGRAFTISGAAASPSMGYHSSPAVAFVMTFFNVRLGWWMPNPSVANKEEAHRKEPRWGLLLDALGFTSKNAPYVYLSDGGHFDNLGLYEMIRRRCTEIVIVDASADPKYTHEDLELAIRKARVDFGATITFDRDDLCEPRRCAIGTIDYKSGMGEGPRRGTIYYIKPVVAGDEPLDVLRYACVSRTRDSEHPFPHQSTADQFFSESQFESYRMLGLHTAQALFTVDGEFPSPEAVHKSARSLLPQACLCGPAAHNSPVVPPGVVLGGDPRSSFPTALHTWSQGAMLASAVTVGGVVSAAGYVTLREATVDLRPGASVEISEKSLSHLQELVEGMGRDTTSSPTPMGEPTVPPPPPITAIPLSLDLKLDQGLREQLTDLIEKLSEVAVRLPPAADAPLVQKAIAEHLRVIREQVSGEKGPAQLAAILDRLNRLDPLTKEQLESEIALLGSIHDRLRVIAPRSNVRGTP